MDPGGSLSESTSRASGWVLMAALSSVALLFALAFGDHGYVPTDQGFILGQSWRVHGGQVPYRDFLYIRAPGSLYLHTIWFWLPDAWIVRGARFGYYAQLAIAGAVPALFALRAGLAASSMRLVCLCVLFFAIALHNFPPMPWYTVDGIFFASLALTALLAAQRPTGTSRHAWRAVASLLAAGAALMKQNYVALPAVVIAVDWGLLVVAYSRRAEPKPLRDLLVRALSSTVPIAAVFTLVAVALHAAGAWEPFRAQVGAASSLRGLIRVGFTPWIEQTVGVAFVIGLLTSIVARRFGSANGWRLRAADCVLLLMPLLVAWVAWDLEVWKRPDNQAGHWLLAAIAGGVAGRAIDLQRALFGRSDARAVQRAVLQVGSLGIAWCASISFGADNPLLGLVAAGAAVETLLPAPSGRLARRAVHLAAWALCAILTTVNVFFLNLETPYRTVARARQTAALHEVFPRFGELYAGPLVGARLRDLKQQIETHALTPGLDFTVVPSFPLAHFLVDRQTAAPMDWYVVFDLFAVRPELISRLERFDGVILLQRRASKDECERSDFKSAQRALSLRIFRNSRLVASSEHFCVLEPRPGPWSRTRR